VLNAVFCLFFLVAYFVGPADKRPVALEQMIILFLMALADGFILLAIRREGRRAA
jgi:hypothetical protein